jgi:2-(1,2-epoxy-1,2-dihydrophenyl)acetyl-CoA isomerase
MSIESTILDGVATITINRPAQMNALDEATRVALSDAVRAAGADASVGAIVLTGAGPAFCAGQDLAAIDELDDAHDTVARTYNPIVQAIADVGVPVIAAVNGAAVGAGMGIALACDIVIMSNRALLACVFGKVGLVPDTGTSWQLVRTVGYLRAYELASSGRRVGADEAVALGLATESVDADELSTRAQQRAFALASGPRLAQILTKRVLRAAQTSDLSTTMAFEAHNQGLAASDDDHVRLRDAFLRR